MNCKYLFLFLLLFVIGCNKEKDEHSHYNIKAVKTIRVASVGRTTTSIAGLVQMDNGVSITESGVVYKLANSTDATITESKVVNTSSVVSNQEFEIELVGLVPSTKYQARTFATNNHGTAYGQVLEFTTEQAITAIVGKLDTANVTRTSVDLSFDIKDNGGQEIISQGVVFSQTSNEPTVATSTKVDALDKENSNFSADLTNLTPNTTYYARAFVTNSVGIAYSNVVQFTTQAIRPPSGLKIVHMTRNFSGFIDITGKVEDQGDAPITWKGVLVSKEEIITESNSIKMTSNESSESFSIMNIGKDLDKGATYYVAIAATNDGGTVIGEPVKYKTNPYLGQEYEGGTVAYIFNSKDDLGLGFERGIAHGYIVSKEIVYLPWFCNLNSSTSGQGAAGRIVSDCTNSAANHSNNLRTNGYDDWYLPTLVQLQKIHSSNTLPNLKEYPFVWSSTPVDSTSAYGVPFSNGNAQGYPRSTYGHVISIRNF